MGGDRVSRTWTGGSRVPDHRPTNRVTVPNNSYPDSLFTTPVAGRPVGITVLPYRAARPRRDYTRVRSAAFLAGLGVFLAAVIVSTSTTTAAVCLAIVSLLLLSLGLAKAAGRPAPVRHAANFSSVRKTRTGRGRTGGAW